MINFVLIMMMLVVMLTHASGDNECGGDDNGLGGVRCQIGRFLLDRQPCNHYLHHDHWHCHLHLHTPPYQVQIIGTLVRLEALGVVFGIIWFAVGCYIFIVVWSFRLS